MLRVDYEFFVAIFEMKGKSSGTDNPASRIKQ